jgi:hypothetical protein
MENTRQIFIEFSAKNGYFQFYDVKSKIKSKINLEKFVFFESFSAISGYDPKLGWIASNPIKDKQSEIMEVRTQNQGIIARGAYYDINTKLPEAAKMSVQIYGCIVSENPHILQLNLVKTGLKSWIEFTNKNPKYYQKTIKIEEPKFIQRADVGYYIPMFDCEPSNETEDTISKNLWSHYLDIRKSFYTKLGDKQ